MASTSEANMDQPLLQMSAVEIQQAYYDTVGDLDWELYEKRDRKYLLQKVAIALCGPPNSEGDLNDDSDEINLQGYKPEDEKQVMKVFNKICEQAKYSHNNENILISILRIVCVAPTKQIPFYKPDPDDYWVDLHDKKGNDVTICIFHAFRLRKCISLKLELFTPHEKKSCKTYIDHEGRVYKNWNQYLVNNNLPKSVMVVPENGEYRKIVSQQSGKKSLVKLTVLPSPALGIKARILSAADTTSIAVNIGAIASLGVGIAAIPLAPVIAPVAFTVAGGMAAATAVYGIVRSSITLADRGKHEQDIGILDRDARGCWVNIALSTLGLSVSFAGKLLAMAASSGMEVRILVNAFSILKYANLVTGAIGVGNSLHDMFEAYLKYGRSPTKTEIFQFTTSLLFLGLGAMSNQTAQEIIQDAQAKTLNEMRENLSSKNQQKSFDKMRAETSRVNGDIKGNAEFIRGVNRIENKEEFFAKMRGINKDLNKNKVRISLSADGQAVFNNEHRMSFNEVGALGKKGRQQVFAKYGSADVKTKNVPTRISISTSACGAGGNHPSHANLLLIGPGEIIKITNFLLRCSQADKEIIADLLSNISAGLHDAFLLICSELLNLILDSAGLNIFYEQKYYIVRLVWFVFDYIKKKRLLGDCDYEKDNSFALVIKEFFQDGYVKKTTILLIKDRFMEWLLEDKKSSNNVNDFKDLQTIRKLFDNANGYKTITAGEVITAGLHHILIKEATVEMLTQWLKQYSQSECDLFVKFCFEIISSLSTKDVDNLVLVNPDEDLLMIVATYLKENCHVVNILLLNFAEVGEINRDVVNSMQKDIMRWLSNLKLRKHKICDICKRINYDV